MLYFFKYNVALIDADDLLRRIHHIIGITILFSRAAFSARFSCRLKAGFPASKRSGLPNREVRSFLCCNVQFACFMLRLMRFFFSSASSTTTLTISPTDSTSDGCRINLSATCEI